MSVQSATQPGLLRVLHCIYDDPANPWVAGGGAVRVFELYRRLADRLGEVTVATGSFPGARDLSLEGISYLRLGARRPYAWSRLSYSLAASRLLARAAYDVAIFDFSTYTPLRLPRHRPVGITVHHLTGESAVERWGDRLGRLVAAQEAHRLRQGRIFSATSVATGERLRALVGPDAEIRLVQAGVPDALFEQPREEADFLLYFGRLDWFQKGLDTLLDAFARLLHARPQLRLCVAGRGKDANRLIERARELGVASRIEVLGAVSEERRMELFSGAQVLLMPSRFEGFGMVAAEAMAAGVPVVASDAGSLPEVIDAPHGGVLVPSGDPGALATAVEELLQNPLTRSALSRSARRSAERFRWDHIAEEHLAFLRAVHERAGVHRQERERT